jgi:spermidine/putrescine ABC transporter ATP-binding subunit
MGKEEGIPCLELRNVVKRFSGVLAVDHVSLEIGQGGVFSLLGPSGCGKSTALRLVAGLETLDDGDILIDGEVVNNIPPYKRDCSMVFQSLALFPHLTVEENIAYGLERRKLPKKEIRRRVGEMVELMGLGLSGMEKRRPAQVSGGQRQRIALARSLVLRPKILLLDEPLSALDRKLRKEMQVELKRIQREVMTTFLYVTHDQKEALSLSDTIAVMHEGRLEQLGTPSEIYETPRTRFIADFMGATNIFTGEITDRSDEEIQLETKDGLKMIARKSNAIPSNQIIGVCVRPERIRVLPKKSGSRADNMFGGKIKEIIYQGDFVEMQISLEQSGRVVYVDLRNESKERFVENEEIVVQWDPESSNILLD